MVLRYGNLFLNTVLINLACLIVWKFRKKMLSAKSHNTPREIQVWREVSLYLLQETNFHAFRRIGAQNGPRKNEHHPSLIPFNKLGERMFHTILWLGSCLQTVKETFLKYICCDFSLSLVYNFFKPVWFSFPFVWDKDNEYEQRKRKNQTGLKNVKPMMNLNHSIIISFLSIYCGQIPPWSWTCDLI